MRKRFTAFPIIYDKCPRRTSGILANQARLVKQIAHSGLKLFKADFRYRSTRDKYEAAAGSDLRQERSYSLSQSAFDPIADNCVAYLLSHCKAYPFIGPAAGSINQYQRAASAGIPLAVHTAELFVPFKRVATLH